MIDKLHDSSPDRKSLWAQGRLAALLASVGGYVDAYAFLNYKVYVSFMSGNTAQTGLQAGLAKIGLAVHNLLPVPAFVLGVFFGTLVLHFRAPKPRRLLYMLVAAFLFASIGCAYIDCAVNRVAIVFLSFGMGAMNTIVTRVGEQPVSLGYVTGCLNNLAQHLALAVKRLPVPNAQGAGDTHVERATVLASIWAAFLMGALLGGAMTPRLAAWTLMAPILLLAALSAVDRTDR